MRPRLLVILMLAVTALAASGARAAEAVNPHGTITFDCAVCHTEETWRVTGNPAGFDHDDTGFPLQDLHKYAECRDCHRNKVFAFVGTQCLDCHTDFHKGRLGPDCQDCHTPAGWIDRGEMARKHMETAFPLVGAHAQVDCDACHRGPDRSDYAGTPSDCYACHAEQYAATTNPPHAASGMGTDCRTCHGMFAATWGAGDFVHPQSFPLTGGHAGRDCSECHTSGSGFTGVSTDCASCHLDDYNATRDPDHAASSYPLDCAQCHQTSSWEGAQIDHDQTDFPLTGKHRGVDCASCHTAGFSGTPTDCYSCHQSDYNDAENHRAQGYPLDCTRCHDTSGWDSGDLFNHSQTSFPLSGAHDGPACIACHDAGFEGTSTACESCHLPQFQSAADPDHVAAGFPQDCSQCHNDVGWEGATIDHTAQTSFPLTGAHAPLDCAACHAAGFTGTQQNCDACHLATFNSVPDPDHDGSGFPMDCSGCHTTATFAGGTIDHQTQTSYPLTGVHITTDCALCHTSGYTGTPDNCDACHLADYTAVADPDHVGSGFPTMCDQCHQTTGWPGAEMDHDLTNFPLTGAHAATDCALCHTSGYTGTPDNCDACHLPDYQNAADPDHISAGFPVTCTMCHDTAAWSGAQLDHDLTDFPLTGAHRTVDCAQCHTSGYTGTPMACDGCHLDDYNATAAPNHAAEGFDINCQGCHNTFAWQPSTFNHNQTSFPLTEGHGGLDCAQCHSAGYSGTPTNCDACHLDDYNGVADPNHVTAQFPLDCTQCHTKASWYPSTFDHAQTSFALTGGHFGLDCIQCHGSGYQNTSTACSSCHLDDYNATVDPNHAAQQFPTDCTGCHQTTAWVPATFDHGQTAFPLTGAHTTVDCAQCHSMGYTGTPTNCDACHLDDYNATVDPNHAVEQFPTDCTGCHQTTAWVPATFDHGQTAFPLTGAHTTVDCAQCHSTGYTGTPTNCDACHLDDYNNTTAPNHAAQQFPLSCDGCHQTTAWTPATFDHTQTGFPLTGAHITTSCTQCHSSGYAGTPTDCYACHAGDFNGATNPNHVSLGFPLDCMECHGTSAWSPSTFNHEAVFPIVTGTHREKWTSCADCHVVPNDITQFECIYCHQHNRTDTDAKHVEVRNYVYNSDACYDCHPDGRSP